MAASVLVGMFLLLAAWVELAASIPGDDRALVELNEAIGTALDEPLVVIGGATATVPLAVFAVVVVVLLRRAQRRREALLFLLAIGVVMLINPLLKVLVARPRPAIRVSPESVSTHSFPSGHSASTAGFVGALLLVAPTRRWRLMIAAVGGVLIVGVAFSRLAISVHYPSDILGGWLWVGAWIVFLWPFRGRPDPQA